MRRQTGAALVRAPDAGRQARRLVAAVCEEWRIGFVEHDAEIVVTELVENTLRHTGSAPRLRLVLRDGELTVAVSDSEPKAAAYIRDDWTEQGRGLGMLLVSQLSKVWGCTHKNTGKTVWAVLRATR